MPEIINVYDFDHTIYPGDSTVDFFLFCFRRKPYILFRALQLAIRGVGRVLGFVTTEQLKERFYMSFLPYMNDIPYLLDEFWEKHSGDICGWYREQKEPNDLVISASPEFLLKPICSRLGIRFIGSLVNPQTGMLLGPNCKGNEKVRRFRELYPNCLIDNFYSDSLSDSPMAEISRQAWRVKNRVITSWW
jgi:phosphoserine phosphatase